VSPMKKMKMELASVLVMHDSCLEARQEGARCHVCNIRQYGTIEEGRCLSVREAVRTPTADIRVQVLRLRHYYPRSCLISSALFGDHTDNMRTYLSAHTG
jgi:hypothetical protein